MNLTLKDFLKCPAFLVKIAMYIDGIVIIAMKIKGVF